MGDFVSNTSNTLDSEYLQTCLDKVKAGADGSDSSIYANVTHYLGELSKGHIYKFWQGYSVGLAREGLSLLDTVFTPYGSPSFLPTQRQISSVTSRLDKLLCSMAQRAPSLVTLSRSASPGAGPDSSTQSYMLPKVLPWIEWQVFLLLNRQGVLQGSPEQLVAKGCSQLTDQVTYFSGGKDCLNCDPRSEPLAPLACPVESALMKE